MIADPLDDLLAEVALIRHFADCIHERNYFDKRSYLLRHIDRLPAAIERLVRERDEAKK